MTAKSEVKHSNTRY